ncbi:MAG: glycerol-3-phosphate 1-O-acyltransferase PlsY [Lachnospiraceae bacterium]|nr:glycerol-3-phosphate 1-O-acyltransferase PlsY [Lachnospiraceae bacterium]
MERIICLVMGYLFGLVQTGFFYGKAHGTDIRQHGSGNSGATNTMRVMGKKAGGLVLLGDVLKCLAACTLARLLFGIKEPQMELLYVLYAGFGAILGHNFPVYLKFKGGKGIACTGALIIAVLDIRILLICLAVFILTIYITRFVSLGSMLGASTFFITWTVITMNGWNNLGAEYRMESCVIVFLVAVLAIVRHHSNIKRLLSGTENKLGSKSK